jgi:hypothetical protein
MSDFCCLFSPQQFPGLPVRALSHTGISVALMKIKKSVQSISLSFEAHNLLCESQRHHFLSTKPCAASLKCMK